MNAATEPRSDLQDCKEIAPARAVLQGGVGGSGADLDTPMMATLLVRPYRITTWDRGKQRDEHDAISNEAGIDFPL